MSSGRPGRLVDDIRFRLVISAASDLSVADIESQAVDVGLQEVGLARIEEASIESPGDARFQPCNHAQSAGAEQSGELGCSRQRLIQICQKRLRSCANGQSLDPREVADDPEKPPVRSLVEIEDGLHLSGQSVLNGPFKTGRTIAGRFRRLSEEPGRARNEQGEEQYRCEKRALRTALRHFLNTSEAMLAIRSVHRKPV